MRKFSVLLTALFLIGVSAVFGQGRSISGKVLDSESGDPIIGASVEVVGAQTGTSTDENGDFTVTLPEGYNTLRFTQTSYKSQDLTARDGMVVRLVLASEVLATAEIEVAMGTKMGKGYVGSAQTVTSETIEKKSPTDVTKALAGEFAGVQIATTTGQPGVSSSVRIRGIASLNAGGDALYVVDGIPYGSDISSIDPSDIVSTTVLKDATATSLYGARGANGVILITTKKGTAGSEGKIEVDLQAGINTRLLPMHDFVTSPEQYVEIGWSGLVNYYMFNQNMTIDAAKAAASANLWATATNKATELNVNYNIWDTNDVIDPATRKFKEGVSRRYSPEVWKDHIFRIGKKYSAGVKLSGGSDKTTYYTSINFLQDEGYYINSDYKRLTALSNLDYSPKKWLTANFKAQYAFSNMNNAGQTDAANNGFNFVYNIPPIYPVYLHNSVDGSIVQDESFGGNAYDYGRNAGYNRGFGLNINPAGALQLDKKYTEIHNLALSNFLKFEFVKDLVITITNGYNFNYQDFSYLMNKYYGDTKAGRIFKTHQSFVDLTSRQQIAYRKTFADVHNFDAMLGHEFRTMQRKNFSASKMGLFKPDDLELDNAVNIEDAGSYSVDYKGESYIGEIRYNFDEKYFFIANGSVYGSSNFAPGKQYGTFASVGAAWNIHRELFMASTRKWLSSLKVRANFGTSGNDQITRFSYTDMYLIINNNRTPGLSFTSKGNKDLTWETVYKTNIGIDLELKKGKLYFEADFYNNLVANSLDARSVASSNGYTVIPVNDGKFRSYGVEFLVKSNVIKTRNFDLNLRLTASSSRAIVVDNPKQYIQGVLVEMPLNNGRAKGHYLGDIYMSHYLGVDPATGYGRWEKWTDANADDPNAGVVNTYDYEHEMIIENGVPKKRRNVSWNKTETNNPLEAARYFNGKNRYPDIFGGFGFDMSTYGFDLSASFEYIIGGYNVDIIYANLMADGAVGVNNYHKDMTKAWNPETPDVYTDVPLMLAGRATSGNTYQARYSGYGDRFLTSNTGLRLSNVRLAYNFPKKIIEKLQLNNLSIWVRGDNLFVLSQRQGYDPFTLFGGGNERYQYTPLSTFVGGIKFSF